jgi:opacity protein-like surface antigen
MVVLLLAAFIVLPAAANAYDYWVINGRGGISDPLGSMANNNTLSYDFGVSARKGFDKEITVGGGVSFVSMPYQNPAAPAPFTASVLDAELVYAPYMPDLFIWPYAKIGVGLYLARYAQLNGVSPNTTSVINQDSAFGIMLGGGVNYPISNEIAANAEVMYNQASIQGGQGDNYNFLTITIGITYYLK